MTENPLRLSWLWKTAPGSGRDLLVAVFAAALAGLTDPRDIPATAAPQTEVWAQAHAHSTRRLFSA